MCKSKYCVVSKSTLQSAVHVHAHVHVVVKIIKISGTSSPGQTCAVPVASGRERRRVKGRKSGGLAAVAVVAASVAGTGCRSRMAQACAASALFRDESMKDVTVRSSEGALAAGCGGGVGSAAAALTRLARYL